MNESDVMLENLLRGAFINEATAPTVSGPDGEITDEVLELALLDGLSSGNIRPLTEAQLNAEIKALEAGDGLGFFRKLRKRFKKIAKKVNVYKAVARQVKRVAKKLKPHLGKIVAVAAIGAAAYYGGPMLKPLMAKAKMFVTAKAKKLFVKKALVNAIKQKAGAAVIKKLQSAYIGASRQEQQQRRAAAAQGELDSLTAKESAELQSVMNEDPVIVPRERAAERARKVATRTLQQQGINMASPQAQQYLATAVEEKQKQLGIGAPKKSRKLLYIGLGVGGLVTVGGIAYAMTRK